MNLSPESCVDFHNLRMYYVGIYESSMCCGKLLIIIMFPNGNIFYLTIDCFGVVVSLKIIWTHMEESPNTILVPTYLRTRVDILACYFFTIVTLYINVCHFH